MNALTPKVKVMLRHEPLKPLAENLVTSKPLWQFQDVFSGALSPLLQAERVQQHNLRRSNIAQVGLHSADDRGAGGAGCYVKNLTATLAYPRRPVKYNVLQVYVFSAALIPAAFSQDL